MSGRGVIGQFLFDRVTVEPGDGAQPTDDGGTAPAAGFQVTGEASGIRAAAAE